MESSRRGLLESTLDLPYHPLGGTLWDIKLKETYPPNDGRSIIHPGSGVSTDKREMHEQANTRSV